MTEAEIKKMVKSELEKINKKTDSIKDDLELLKKKSLDEDGVKKIVRSMFINHYKWMWEKSSIYINKL